MVWIGVQVLWISTPNLPQQKTSKSYYNVSLTVDEQVEASVGLCNEHYNALYTNLMGAKIQ